MKRSKSGFSMTELLTVVAILAVLIAVAVPAVIAASKTLKMRELDDTAREIFLAAQNTLTARKADGTLSAPEGDQVEGQEGWYWLFDGDTDFLLPDGAVEPAVAENHIAIWYNAGSAMVVEVYYGEKNGSFASPGCDEWNVGAIQNGAYSNSRRQSGSAGEARAEKRIGYYDGTDLPRGAVEQLLPPVLEIVNSDELKVIVTVPKQHKKNDLAAPLIPSELTVLVEGTGEGGQKVLLSFDQTGCTDISSGDSRKYELVLDSLTDKQFKEVCLGITPGANIRVTAKLSAPAADGTKYLSASAWKETNSLFEARTGDTVSVACARHLQNLEDGFSGFACASAVNVKQTSRIDWPADKCDFFSIENDCIKAYDGGKLEIRGLDAGLFNSTSENMQMEHIRIVNPIIEGSGNVGALVNTAQNARIDDCWIYATTIKPEKTEPQTEDFNALKTDFIVKGGTVGGLVGSATGCTITNSFAALSKVEGNTVGGLIGSASGCIIKNCYATAENLSGSTSAMFIGSMTGGKVTGCYASGNIASSGGTVSGFANGSGTFSGSYCAVSYNEKGGTPTGLTPQYGFAAGSIDSCAYLTVNAPVNENSAAHKNYEELKGWVSGWQALSAAQTHPYRAELDGEAYPFPGLDMPHYGSWPVQTVDGIKLFDGNAAGSRELKYILVPKGGSVTFWVEAQSDDKAAMVEPKVGDVNGTVLFKISAGSYDPATGRKSVTVKGSLFTGTTYVDLTAEGFTLRAVVVVYEAEVTLQGKNRTNGVTATGKADQTGTGSIGHLSLQTNGKVGEFTASLTKIVPKKSNILGALSAMQSSLGAQGTLSATAADFDSWDKLLDGDPAVTANGDLETGTWVLTLNEEGKNLYGSKEDSDGNDAKLTVTGAATGTAKVSARWAMDPKLEAVCDVQMKGARALISEAAATTSLDGKVKKTGYPYRLDLTAEPKENITLTFTPRLFNAPMGGTQQYTWKVQRIEDGRWLEENGDSKPTENDGIWTYTLKDHEPRATYRVTLEYTSDSGEKSVDYMTFSVYRKASKTETDYSYIVIKDRDTGVSVTTTSAGTVEQVTAVGYETANQIELEGYVSGAANTRVRWLMDAVCGDGGETWVPVTGNSGSQTVKDSGGIEHFKVEWLSKESTTTVDGSSVPTGGAVRITGLDCNEYDTKYTVKLKAEAMESGGSGESASSRTVTVDVMPKMEINPKAKTVISGNQATYVFQTARQDGKYKYNWTTKANGKENGPTEGSYSYNVTGIKDTTVEVECQYGPHRASATFTWMGFLSNMPAPINADYVIVNDAGDPSKNTEYFIVEKGKERELELTWGCAFPYSIRKYPESIAAISITPTGGKDTPDSQNGGVIGYVGNRTYKVSGNEYTGTSVKELKWRIGSFSPFNWDFPKYFAVVGMEINEPEILRDEYHNLILSKGETLLLSTTTSFPTELMDGDPSLTWESDHPELVSVDSDGKITAVKNGASTYSATITATYTVKCVNGQTYTYKDYVTAKVEPQGTMDVTLRPCTGDDAEALNKAFALTGSDKLTAESCMAAVNENGVLTLLRDEAYGYDTMYLKATATLDGAAIQDLTEYISNVYGDEYYLKLDVPSSAFYAENADCRDTLYIRVKAEAANATPTDVELTAELGTDSDQKTIRIYDIPQIRLRHGSDDVTNGSLPVYLNDANTKLPVLLTAEIEPKLYSAADTEKVSPLLQNGWELEAPVGYSAEEYLTLTVSADGAAQVALKDLARLPDFRVVLHASCENSSAGYAVVFVPEDDTGSGSMTRRKRYNVLGA